MNIEKRIQKGKVTKAEEDYANVILEDGSEGRLNFVDSYHKTLDDFRSYYEKVSKEQKLLEFVLRVKKKNGDWHLSDKIERYREDWGRFHYEKGAVFEFEVDSYVGDKGAKCKLVFDEYVSVIEAYIKLDDIIPFSNKTIDEVLEIGDRIKAVVEFFNTDKNNLEISIIKLHDLYQKEYDAWKEKASLIRRKKLEAEPKSIQCDIEIKTDPTVIIIEDDKNYTRSIKRLLLQIGVEEVYEVHNLQTLKNTLRDKEITHAILGYNFNGMVEFRDNVAKELKNKAIYTALCSGDSRKKEILEYIREYGFRFLAKPFELSLLVDFLNKEDSYDLKEDISNKKEWSSKNVLAQKIEDEIYAQIQSVAKEIDAFNVVLVKELSKGRYRVKIALKEIDESNIRYERTSLDNIISHNIEIIEKNEKMGDFFHIVPPDIKHLYGYPIKTDGEVQHALLVFKKDALENEQKSKIDSLIHYISESFVKLTLQEAMEDEELFASIGRMSAGYMHEVNNEMGILQHDIKNLELFIQKSDECIEKNELRNYEKAIHNSYARLKRVNDLFLNTIQREREEELNLIDTTQRIIQIFLAENDIHVEFDYTKKDEWNIRIPPFPYEQALKNVLLNASYHLKGLKYAKVGFDFKMDSEYIYVTISDNGDGMHKSTKENLFRPRSSKKKRGKGMGLYLSKVMLESIGGDIKCVSSYIFGGSSFEISLPLITQGMENE